MPLDDSDPEASRQGDREQIVPPDATDENERNLRDWDCQAWALLAEAAAKSKQKTKREKKRGGRQ